MIHVEELQWVESGGGPLVLADEITAMGWLGTEGSTVSEETDYDRACDVNGYLELLSVKSGNVLILGDEPMPTIWWSARDHIMLVRWESAISTDAVLSVLESIRLSDFTETGIVFSLKSKNVILFDSAYSGREIMNKIERRDTFTGEHYIYSQMSLNSIEINLKLNKINQSDVNLIVYLIT